MKTKNKETKKIARVLRAAGNPVRVEILQLLNKNGETSVNEIVKKIKQSQALTSFHLILLKKAGFLKSERAGKQVLYSIDSKELFGLLNTVIKVLK